MNARKTVTPPPSVGKFPAALLDKLIDCILAFDPSYLKIFNLRHPLICSRVADRLLQSEYAEHLTSQDELEVILGMKPKLRLVK